jgi:monofunctional biosynthetic peptidoglycan transglycosylase
VTAVKTTAVRTTAVKTTTARTLAAKKTAPVKKWAVGLVAGWTIATVLPVFLLRFVDPPTTAFMLARRMEASEKNEKLVIRQLWVPRSRISVHLQRALIAAEDQKFFSHWGFDVEAIEDAVEDRIEGKSTRGASTLTQQVAKNLFLWSGQSFVRKAIEVYFTVLLELLWSKERILEVHLNIAEYGNGVYGVEEACRLNFQKSAAAVSPEEAAMLVVVLPSPRTRKVIAPSPKVRERSRWVLEQMERVKLN